MAYLTLLERIRASKYMKDRNYPPWLRNMIASGTACLANQAMLVPLDIISQRLMIHGQGMSRSVAPKLNGWIVINDVYKNHGIRGFYKGWLASTLTYGRQ